MLPLNLTDHQKPRLIFSLRWNLEKHRVTPKALGLNEIDAMFRAVGVALFSGEFERNNGMENIP
jgi:hypothetical protein